MKPFDCIIPWSGGVESTALVWWAKENGHVPLTYHVTSRWDGRREEEKTAVKEMANILNVQVQYLSNHADGHMRWNDTKSYLEIKNFSFWMWWGVLMAGQNPDIKNVWYGNNCGLYEVGDGLGDGDESFAFVSTVRGCRELARGLNINFDIYCPYKASKIEQWNWLPSNIRKLVASSDKKPEWVKWQKKNQ